MLASKKWVLFGFKILLYNEGKDLYLRYCHCRSWLPPDVGGGGKRLSNQLDYALKPEDRRISNHLYVLLTLRTSYHPFGKRGGGALLVAPTDRRELDVVFMGDWGCHIVKTLDVGFKFT
jgi:hypothetical protein